MAYNFCCDSYHVPNLIYIYYTIVILFGVKYVTCAISWGCCSLIRLLVVMSVVVVLVLHYPNRIYREEMTLAAVDVCTYTVYRRFAAFQLITFMLHW